VGAYCCAASVRSYLLNSLLLVITISLTCAWGTRKTNKLFLSSQINQCELALHLTFLICSYYFPSSTISECVVNARAAFTIEFECISLILRQNECFMRSQIILHTCI
jgi:hypothetical protein